MGTVHQHIAGDIAGRLGRPVLQGDECYAYASLSAGLVSPSDVRNQEINKRRYENDGGNDYEKDQITSVPLKALPHGIIRRDYGMA